MCDRRFIWQLSSVPNLRGFLDAVKDEGNRQMCTEVIDAFEIEVVSIATELEKVISIISKLSIPKKNIYRLTLSRSITRLTLQFLFQGVIHGDFNEQNILVRMNKGASVLISDNLY